jgi:hypothetical protein
MNLRSQAIIEVVQMLVKDWKKMISRKDAKKKIRIYNPKEGNLFTNLIILLIPEYWSVGVMAIGLTSCFFNTPTLQYWVETIQDFWQP